MHAGFWFKLENLQLEPRDYVQFGLRQTINVANACIYSD